MAAEKHLNGTGFTELIRAGHTRLKQLVDVVNALNIFPVPDGDTGTNMELSLASGVSSLDKLSHPTLASATQTLASGLLMGARGNSGVILSQLFRGFSKAAQNA
jgi:dihydroxyacetone kinase-like predicted kinase